MLQCNCTIVAEEPGGQAIVIDPGDDPEAIIERLSFHRLALKEIVCTHTHIDHVGAIFELQEKTGTRASIHHADLFLYENLEVQATWLGMTPPKPGHIDGYLRDGTGVQCSGIELGVLHTPGHTPGSTCFVLAGARPTLFAGDTLFRNSIGRTDLWGGSMPDILSSIHKKLLSLEDDTLVIPGHGPATSVGHERHNNPFLR